MCERQAKMCPRCKGSGQVFDWSCLLLTVGLPLAMLLDRMEPRNPITKDTCPRCKGSGEVH